MNNPKISVILPVRNGGNYIKDAITSILQQENEDFELIIINDGSTDQTESIIHSFHDSRIIVFNQPANGIATSLNFGISNARGQYIARMDADDVATPNRLRLQAQHLDKFPLTGVVGSLVNHKGDETKHKGYATYCQWINGLVQHEQMFEQRFVDAPLAHPSVMFRINLIEKFGPYDEGGVPEDYELWLRWMAQGVIFDKIDKYLLDWYDRDDRISRTHPDYDPSSFLKIKSKYLKMWYDQTFGSLKPEIWIWGSGKSVYNKTKYLEEAGLSIEGFIDVVEDNLDHKKRKTIHYSGIKMLEDVFILSFVSDRIGRKNIIEFFKKNGYVAGQHYYLLA